MRALVDPRDFRTLSTQQFDTRFVVCGVRSEVNRECIGRPIGGQERAARQLRYVARRCMERQAVQEQDAAGWHLDADRPSFIDVVDLAAEESIDLV